MTCEATPDCVAGQQCEDGVCCAALGEICAVFDYDFSIEVLFACCGTGVACGKPGPPRGEFNTGLCCLAPEMPCTTDAECCFDSCNITTGTCD